MIVDDLLDRLERVQPRGSGKWMARCPSHHPDRTPSLSIREGEDGRILLHDFGGCQLEEILSALGLRPTDLFPDHDPDPHRWQVQRRQRDIERTRREQERVARGRRLDALREADNVIRAARDIDINELSDLQLHVVLTKLGDAYHILEREMTDGS